MARISLPLRAIDADYLSQVRYSMTFVSEDIASYSIDEKVPRLDLELQPEAIEGEVRRKVEQLLQRFERRELGFKSTVHFQSEKDLPVIDAWKELLERKWISPVGTGHVILRGPAAQLMSLVDAQVESRFVREFGAELEIYPATILSKTLDRCHHFTSFPEHMDFVAHLKQDLDVLNRFSAACKERGWSPELHEATMALSDFSIAPSCCYHCYEGMEGWQVEKPGRCITAVLGCHRYEGANHQTMSRLRAFTMREVVWVGQPGWVLDCRARADSLITQWAKDWELSCTYETANDMFFTDDYAVKASFQRQQEAKRELRLRIPSEGQAISVFSSNFHSVTFGKAFGISAGGRPAVSACVGWGYERWVYAIFSQFGLDVGKWPAGLRRDFESHAAKGKRA